MSETKALNQPVFKIFVKYLVPSIGATLVTAIYLLGDSVIIGKGVGADGIAALNILIPFFNLFYATGYLFGTGGAVYFSILHGTKDYENDKKYYTFSLFASLAFSIAYIILLQIFFKPIVYFIGAKDTIYPLVEDYGRLVVWFAPVFVLSTFLQTFVRNDSSPVCAMIGVISGGITNIIFDYIFIYIFNMGMTGGSVATMIGTSLSCLILLSHYFKKNNNLKIKLFKPNFKMAFKIIKTGIPSFFIEFANGIVISLFNIRLASIMGDVGIAAYGIITNSSLMAAAFANGIAQGAQPLIAINFGGNRKDRVRAFLKFGRFFALGFAAVALLMFELFPTQIVNVFVHSTPQILNVTVPGLRIYALTFIGMYFNIFHSTYFQAVEKPTYSIIITVFRGLLVCAPLIFILSALWGVTGLWFVMPVTDTAVFLISLVFFVIEEKKTQNQ